MQFCFALPLAALILVSTAEAAVTTATFDNLDEGIYGTTLNDPLSGIVVHDIASLTQIATIDDVQPSEGFLFVSGNYLTTNGYVPGPGGGESGFSSLAIDLPAAAQNASLDLLYINLTTNRTITLNGLNSSGQVVATVSASIPGAFLPARDARLTISSAARDIVSLSLVAGADLNDTVGFGGGIDNVTFDATPEPAALALVVLAPLMIGRQRRRSEPSRLRLTMRGDADLRAHLPQRAR